MKTNLSSFIQPLKDNENSLKGVVTPYDQKFNRKEEDGFSLFEIINNESLMNRFAKNTFPDIQIMDNGEIFMVPVKRVIQTLHEYYIKWIILDNEFKPSHDNDYPYANIPKEGYLAKIIIPVLSECPDDFSIEYVCNINHIQTKIHDSINTINQYKVNGSTQNAIDVNMKEDLTIEDFDPQKYPEFYKMLLNKNEFFKKYLNHIFD